MSTVVTGIIDDGLAFAHERFCNRAGETRVHYALRQRVSPAVDLELTKGQINALLPLCTHSGMLDEDEFYRRAGWVDILGPHHGAINWRVSHGTHVMDLACGFDPSEDRDDRPIVCVQLPAEVTSNPSGAARSDYVLRGMRYILRRADRIAHDLHVPFVPVVINFSFGAVAGPHDGTSELEQEIDEIIRLRKARFGPLALEVVLPAGNSYLSRCHASCTFPSTSGPGSLRELSWRVLPDDHTPSFLEIWLPCRGAMAPWSRLSLTVTAPTGHVLSVDEVPGAYDFWPDTTVNHAEASYREPVAAGGRGRFLVVLRPTAALERGHTLAPSGVWTVKLQNRSLNAAEVVHAWIERDDTPYGYRTRGRQSFFDQLDYERFDDGGHYNEVDKPASCLARRASLINSIATGSGPVVIGGLSRKEMRVALYSAGGPIQAPCGTSNPDCYRPDAITVSDNSKVHAGVLAAGSRNGSVVAMRGTSVAAPQITRWIAGRLAAGNPLYAGDRAAVQKLAADQEAAASPGPRPPIPPLPDPRYGAGRIVLQPDQPSILSPEVPRPRFVEI